jgi:2,4-dienoyl-CoA reductase-like NADH-dependent reductase (Old Yellow Enzyme family)/thioredoxin reductase
MKFEKVLEPLKIGGMVLKNRFIMGPMETNFPPTDGTVNERLINYYAERARGSAALIITDGAYAHISGKCMLSQTGMDRDELIENHRMLTDRIHQFGGKIAIQLNHAGRQGSSQISGHELMAPSAVMCPVTGEPPRAMSKEDIHEIQEAFAMAAFRAKKAGYDAVEFHGANGYLINEFLSPHTNKRTDEYGGSEENRFRFAAEMIGKAREYCGEGFPLMFKLCADEFVPDGIHPEDAAEIAERLVRAGIDAITVTAGIYESMVMAIPPAAVKKGVYVENAARVKKRIRSAVPVIAIGRINDPEMAENILLQGQADAVCMAREFLADPFFVSKVLHGQEERIRKCIGCNQGCVDRLFAGENVRCILNAQTGFEKELDLSKKTAHVKKIMVVGGGPAGLEAARVAAERGHRVTLYDSRRELGGQLLLASVPPAKGEIRGFVDYLVREIRMLGVEVHSGMTVTADLIARELPDAVILATGSKPIIPGIPGKDRKCAVTADQVLTGDVKPGKNVVVIGGGLVGAEVSEYLAENGHEVSVIEMRDDIAADMGSFPRYFLMKHMNELGIHMYAGSIVKEIGDSSVILEKEGRKEEIKNVDSVVFAVGYRPDNALAEEIKIRGIECHLIGESRRISDAVHEGFETAYQL